MVRRYKECRNCGRRLTTHESTTKAAVKRRMP
jgi:transcriptional regulator NrdR family protein